MPKAPVKVPTLPEFLLEALKGRPWLIGLLAASALVTVWAATRRAPPPPPPIPAAVEPVAAAPAPPEPEPETQLAAPAFPPSEPAPAPAAAEAPRARQAEKPLTQSAAGTWSGGPDLTQSPP